MPRTIHFCSITHIDEDGAECADGYLLALTQESLRSRMSVVNSDIASGKRVLGEVKTGIGTDLMCERIGSQASLSLWIGNDLSWLAA